MKKLIIKGAREHNLKNVDLELPRDKLIVVSGLSGSGKSSLAFDTIYAEGQRRYVESLSAYARQFLGRLDKPDVDYIDGLSPAISVEQKTTHRNPRSTVGTVTEIYDYLRLLYAKIGVPRCPSCGRELRQQGVDQIVAAILANPPETRLLILAPVAREKKGEYRNLFLNARNAGFARLRVDGDIIEIGDMTGQEGDSEQETPGLPIRLDKRKKHAVDIIVDRIIVKTNARQRIADSVEKALEVSGGTVVTAAPDGTGDRWFSRLHGCPDCNISFPELTPQLFSFNSHAGACHKCAGLGVTLEFDPDLVIPDKTRSFRQGAIKNFRPSSKWAMGIIEGLGNIHGFEVDTPIRDIPEQGLQAILYGKPEPFPFSYVNSRGERRQMNRPFGGVMNRLEHGYKKHGPHPWFRQFMRERPCDACQGRRLTEEALHVFLEDKNIYDITAMSVSDTSAFFEALSLSETEMQIAKEILKEIRERLSFLRNVGLGYLTLDRRAATLSGGEAQRIRLATQIGSSLMGVLYILDEPSIGLHQRDNQRLIDTLCHLRDLGNTVIVVEHDEQTLKAADYIVDLGPGAGVHGGEVVAAGTYSQMKRSSVSLTGRYLSGKLSISVPENRRRGNGKHLLIRGAREHNLKGIDVTIPLGRFVVITGVSGSGKSTLMSDILYPALVNRLSRANQGEGQYDGLEGVESIDKVINIDQSPIGRTPRSNPATYVGLFTDIRNLFARLPSARSKGYKPGRFSFNVKGGRCENCRGDGTIKVEMHFLADVYITCDVCKGRRYNHETLEIRYKGKNINDILNMTVDEAVEFFTAVPKAMRKLSTLRDVGLGYIKLGQSALTLSGGEAQRVKLAHELSRPGTGNTVYILDEPTTGLHFADVKQLLEVLHMLVDKGNTVILIEHNLDVIKQADYIVDLGPEGGEKGGNVIAAGTPEEVAESPVSYTGAYLREILSRD